MVKEMLKKVRNNAYVSKKLQAVIAGKESSISAVARICKISRAALTEWIKHLKFSRAEKLLAPYQRRIKSKLNKNQREQIEIWVEKNPNITIKEVQIKISEEFGLNIGKSTVHREIQRIYITPRPMHHKQDKNKQEELKNTAIK
ncbi:putative transposase [Wolbachia endosymbiont of Armadillidium vulgare str. wVulC]|nr:putative transposase [Wolbachia endosymbiont of Armadillidium vulgare str. wVulC]